MKKLRNLIDVLSESDIDAIISSFYRKSDKVAQLFQLLIDGKSNDEIKEELQISLNAYTTLGSRLNNKIQNHLVEIAHSPKDDILKKLRNIDDLLFIEEPRIALVTLKKLERELIKYDLSNELTIVYKHLKRLHINKPEYFNYSKLYNRHVAYSLALDKAEDILSNYFREYGFFYVMKDDVRAVKLNALYEEMINVCALYQSHRMQIYKSAMEIMHRLHVNPMAYKQDNSKPIEDVFNEVEEIFKKYPSDSIYVHLRLIFKAFQFEYYFYYLIIDKANEFREELKPSIPQLLVHYENYGFSAQVLNGLLHLQLAGINTTNPISLDELPGDLNIDNVSDPSVVMIYVYRANCEFYKGDYSEASKLLFELGNRVSFKEYYQLHAEIKCITALVKFYQKDMTLFTQNLASAQRLLRKLDKSDVPQLAAMVKMLGILVSKNDLNRIDRLNDQLYILENTGLAGYNPLSYLKLNHTQLISLIN